MCCLVRIFALFGALFILEYFWPMSDNDFATYGSTELHGSVYYLHIYLTLTTFDSSIPFGLLLSVYLIVLPLITLIV